MELNEIMEKLRQADLDAYRALIQYCESRQSGVEGIPAIIGLDDLTDPDRPVYEGAPMDQKMSQDMALDAMLLTWLYAQQPDRDPHYPAVAPAMSALAEKSFLLYEGEETPAPYRSLYQNTDE